jgi:hypothetical protein
MTPDEERADVLCRVLMALFPGAPFSIDVLTTKILEGLGMIGWSLSYDPDFTKKNIEAVVEAVRAQHPTPTEFVPPRPPERWM